VAVAVAVAKRAAVVEAAGVVVAAKAAVVEDARDEQTVD
jgi:hypothetical protein